MMDELIKVLEKTVSQSQSDQNEAIKYIENFSQSDLNSFLKILSDVLVTQSNQPVVRAAAGLQLKNQLTARDEAIKQAQQDKWRNLPVESRCYIKERVFNALGTEIFRPSSAPQCVAYIAIVELPEKQWLGLVDALVQNITNPDNSDQVRLATLEAIGYICQDIDKACIEEADLNQILTAIINVMRNHCRNNAVIQAATSTLSGLFEKRLKNMAKAQRSVTFEELGKALNIEPCFAEKIMAHMIRECKIQAHLNQIEQVVHFDSKDCLQLFDEDILRVCSDVNNIVEKIRNVVPSKWWMDNYQASD